ncbi:MAG: DNA topoisomerase I, partial [Paramuribaculum sp.]|nr:DNA topoisomerase I [Paramuribaculum sp.]
TGRTVSVKIGRFGPVVQIGESSDTEKPQFASLRKDQSVFDITLEQALKLFDLPRNLGEFEGKDITVAVGRFGPYIRHDNKFVSIPKDISPLEITAEEAKALIIAKREADSKKTVKVFEEDPAMMILNGRFGVYISYNKSNYKIPKSVTDPASLTYEECKKIVESQPEPAKKTRRTTTKKK